jgi:hypothetical protein
MDVFTQNFVNTHGKEPKGNGCWVFEVLGGTEVVTKCYVPGQMRFTDAKVWAKAWVRNTQPNHGEGCDLSVAP